MIEIRLPKPGPEIENATITRWQCKEGEKIQIGDILAIIKTPIGSFKVAAEEQGILESILQGEGASIDFDEPIAIMHPELTITDFPDLSLEGDATLPLPMEDTATEGTPEAETVGVVESGDGQANETEAETEVKEILSDAPRLHLKLDSDDPSQDTREEATRSEVPAVEESSDEGETKSSEEVSSEKESVVLETKTPSNGPMPMIEVSPAARKMADRVGIDLGSISGTGDNGKILYIDVENAIQDRELASASLQSISDPDCPPAQTEANSFESYENQETANLDEAGKADSTPTLMPLISLQEDVEGRTDTAESPNDQDSLPSIQSQIIPENLSFESGSETAKPSESVEEHAKKAEPDTMPESALTPELTDAPDPLETTSPAEEPSLREAEPEAPIDTTAGIEPFPHPEPQDLPISNFGEVASQFNLSKRDDLIIPFNSSKRIFADNQIDSNRSVPHLYLFAEVDWTDALLWLKDQHQRSGIKVQLPDLVVKATGQALAMMPEMNAFVRNDRMILKRSVNIGVTTAADDGVVTPVIPDVYHKSLEKVAEVVKKNTDLAVRSKVVLDYDTTFTVTVLDNERISRIVPLISAPQTGCLAMGAIRKQVIPFGDFIAIRSCSELTLACDSRAVDPKNAARFLQSICNALEMLKSGEPDPDWTHGNEQLRLI